MDKYEYKVRAEEIKALISEGEFAEAMKIADTIDWRRVKSVMMLCTISDLYKINRKLQESKDILLMAYERHPGGRMIVYSLCELSIKMGEFVQAIEYYKEFVQIAPKDTGRYILQYKLYEAQDVSLEERIAVLEEFKKRDYREKWAYELAYLYHRVGLETKCVEECDELVLWFGEGRYVIKALELKQLHQPLTPGQQEKYLLLKQERELLEAQMEEETQDEGQETEEAEDIDEIQENEKIKEFSEYAAEQSQTEEDDGEFRVKTVDVGQYNTINLQKELAESMKEILGEEESSLEPAVRSIVAPLLQETEDITPVTSAVNFLSDQDTEEKESLSRTAVEFRPEGAEKELVAEKVKDSGIPETPAPVKFPQPQPTTEEVFFEDVKDLLLENTKEIDAEEISSKALGDTKELHPKRKVFYPEETPAQASPVLTAQPVRMAQNMKSSGFEQMLSQEYDGQIRLVVPASDPAEKQITGQMNITDIMAEWERMKRENEEKRREDIRKRVQEHTGNMFSEFDEATKTGVLEQLEKTAAEAILKEAEEGRSEPPGITSEKEKTPEEPTDRKKEDEALTALPNEEPFQEKAPVSVEEIIDLETAALSALTGNPAEKLKSAVEDANRLRPLSEEEEELFGKFIHNKKVKEQVIHAVDTMSMDSYTDNIIVTGEEGAGTLELAKNLIRMLQLSDSNFNGKVARITGAALKKKNVEETLSKLTDGALIIERATEMSSNTASDLNQVLSKENCGLLVIMEGKKDEMNIFLRKNHVLMDNFNARIDIEALNDHALVEYARQYAEEMEYSIDELGILALHTRIADMQTSDHEVTVAEVRELVDDAIYFADKKNFRHFFDVLFGKRYDEEDMIILREKDFMHY